MKYLVILLICPCITFANNNQDLTGVWELTAASWSENTKEYADCKIIKFITKDRWASIFYRPKTGEVAGSGGGTYTYHNNRYVEKVEYFTWDSTAVGSQQTFAMEVVDNTLIQKGKIQTEKYDVPYHAYYTKVDDLHDYRASEDFVTGTWSLKTATWGKNNRSEDFLDQKYGEVIKIITPKYYLVSFFDKEAKTTGGFVYGTQKIKSTTYNEHLVAWTWDLGSTGKRTTYDWSIDNQGHFRQSGNLPESEKYHNYKIEENYVRLESANAAPKLWSTEDRKFLTNNLLRTQNEIIKLTQDLSLAQWQFQPDEQSWSIAQVLEHIALYDHFTLQNSYISFNLKADPAENQYTRDDQTNISWMGEEKPHTAYKYATPLGLVKGSDNLIYLNNIRALLIKFVETTKRDLKAHFTPRSNEQHKLRSIHGSIVVHFGHTDRHIRQIERILNHENFPD